MPTLNQTKHIYSVEVGGDSSCASEDQIAACVNQPGMKLDRRRFLGGSAALVAATGAQYFMGIPALADYAVGPTVRRNASTMSANDPILRGYRRAIAAMRALPDENPCSWFYQAAIHGTTDPRNLTAWNTCHMDPSFFWAWHRMYLYWFERIVRKYGKMYDWAIPYWDWTNQSERAMPAPFRVVGNALYDASRNASINAGGELSSSLATSVSNAMTLLNYFGAQSSVNGPHGSVHITVGGNMSGLSSAARDPIFYLHHSQVDRLWNLWLAQGGGRSSPVGDADWRNTTYTFFDECCNEVSINGCDVLRAAKQLSYAYEGEPAQVNQYCPRVWTIDPAVLVAKVLVRWPGPFEIRREAVRFELDPRRARLDGGERLHEVLSSRQHSATLNIRGIEADVQPGVTYEVYLGPPDLKPDPQSRYFVGAFGLFSAGIRTREQHYEPADFVFPADKALSTVRNSEQIVVMLVPTNGMDAETRSEDPPEPRAALSIREISIETDPAMPQPPQDEQEELRREEEVG